ncbi:PaaX family transcriptional regulator [Mycobacterium bourgelatii]|uniref:PaaX family transcriptional regulator n=1 Tax=Mycobacterium bourgelatii TaxID=1273442 RepID=A0A7I9YS89_MYCBU|nr:PaaX family transcriptional regulator C-terminal domain-containing protein [Mycobacterium bourgelatii]MCV6977036.1 PaaX family transcriptional regulator [Mycobacterium bourgelatii]GFG91561.1 PaaX family transcriptional regulator [Mycobacterium bourgelatii]
MTVGEATIDAASRWPDGGASAGSLLLTVLGEFVYPRGGPVWTAALVTGLAALGIEEKAARQAIARTAAKGLLESEKSGRRVSWHITRSGTRLLTEGTRRIYGFLTDPSPWDGQWLVLSVGVPETQRKLRQRLRTRLTWLGMGSPSPGIWILPDVSKVGEVETIVDELGLGDKAFAWTGKLTTIGKAETLIGDAWSLTEVEGRYADFLATFGELRATTPLKAFQAQVRLVHAWRQFPFLDPALPRELLDHDWPGPQAAALFHRRHDEWHAPAQQYWTELEAIS